VNFLKYLFVFVIFFIWLFFANFKLGNEVNIHYFQPVLVKKLDGEKIRDRRNSYVRDGSADSRGIIGLYEPLITFKVTPYFIYGGLYSAFKIDIFHRSTISLSSEIDNNCFESEVLKHELLHHKVFSDALLNVKYILEDIFVWRNHLYLGMRFSLSDAARNRERYVVVPSSYNYVYSVYAKQFDKIIFLNRKIDMAAASDMSLLCRKYLFSKYKL